ncbi:mucosa-associated lymphoid tissue lymphoma translocation protein 1 isoform X2 [Scyliorhinus canicula]|uniref:mucosa-associated lymphoid tissue lymphoma translocation protein 1 isoform X2 n=1 Tax=Scyliorhinus canicula TaxID=7830 RepID=UPI0018F54153|nr:mucosa-associated lymphoid tissue lymphoma translocation protein 1 isoform X2 [Scyliorhinus canicula]
MPAVPRATPVSSDIVITKQPECASVPAGCPVTLHCVAMGPTPLHYQWFEGQQEISGAAQPALLVNERRSGIYVCRVNDQQNRCVFSDWAKVKVHCIKSALPHRWQGEPVIGLQPEPLRVKVGQRASLKCVAFGVPAPKYQWYRNGIQLPHQTKAELAISTVEMRHHGTYLCSVANDRKQECWSSAADMSVVENIPIATSLPSLRISGSGQRKGSAKSPTVCRKPDTPQEAGLCATDKVALLIGNMNYVNHPKLVATMMDVMELCSLLHQLDFRVVSLLDLTKDEMQSAVEQFLQLLDRGVYALFYYAGHGYECSGRNYMVPVNAPNPYRPENCINVQKILCRMQVKNTALNVLLLDMCRKWYNQTYLPSDLQPLAPTGNIVYGYATCEDAEAYEVQDGERSSGIFMKYLKRHILKKEKVTQILETVSEDMGKDQLITGKQVMEIRHTLKECRALTDKICTRGHTVQLRVRNERWKRANKLPERRTVRFPCGVGVELTCSAKFSNVMMVYAKIKTRPPQVTECKVSLLKPEELARAPSDLSVGSAQMDTLLTSLNDRQQSDTTLNLCGLHKLEQPLILRVTVRYRLLKENPKLEETAAVNLGHPLIARLELYRTMPAARVEADATSTACGSGTRTGANKREVKPPACPARMSNQPEENDESDVSNGS